MTARITPAKQPVQLRLVATASVERARVVSLTDAIAAKNQREYQLDQTLDEHASTMTFLNRLRGGKNIVEMNDAMRMTPHNWGGDCA